LVSASAMAKLTHNKGKVCAYSSKYTRTPTLAEIEVYPAHNGVVFQPHRPRFR
jgi:hypothetical protein